MVKNSNYWFEVTHKQKTGLPRNVDTVVIGGGMTGLLLLSQLLRIDDHEACLVEENIPSYRASGRGLGMMMARGQIRFSDLTKTDAEEYYKAVTDNNNILNKGLSGSSMDVGRKVGGCLNLANSQEEFIQLEAEREFLESVGHPTRALSREDCIRLFQTDMFFGGFYDGSAGSINPMAFCEELRIKIASHKDRILSHSQVISVEYNSDGSLAVAIKNKGTIRAKNVVFCTNAYTHSILPEFTNKIIPYKTQVSVSKPFIGTGLEFDSVMINNNFAAILKHENRLMVSGMRSVLKNNQKNLLDDSEISPKVLSAQKDLLRVMSHDNSRGVDYTWAGIVGMSKDGLPFVGPVPNKPNQFIAAGFGGFGLSQFCQSALIVKDYIVDGFSGRSGSDLFDPGRAFKDA